MGKPGKPASQIQVGTPLKHEPIVGGYARIGRVGQYEFNARPTIFKKKHNKIITVARLPQNSRQETRGVKFRGEGGVYSIYFTV